MDLYAVVNKEEYCEMKSAKKWQALSIVLPAAFGVLMVILLETQTIHSVFGLRTSQIPIPSTVIEQLFAKFSKVRSDCWFTVSSALTGLALGSAAGFAAASLSTVWPRIFYGSQTVMVAITSISVIALAPVMNRWFSSSWGAKTAVVTIACMGAMSVTAYKGLNSLPQFSLDLMSSYAASKKTVFFRLRVPNSIPYVFVGLRVNVASAMVSAIISEFFATETSGLGYNIKNSLKMGNQKILGWAYILVAAAVSILIYAVVSLIEKRITKWRIS